MKLIDSNIVIYSYQDAYKYLRPLVLEPDAFVSEITRLEVLGFHALGKEEEEYFTDLFLEINVLEVDKPIFDAAIRMRKTHRMSLGDSILAATALIHGLEIYTRNMVDFTKISDLKIINPIV